MVLPNFVKLAFRANARIDLVNVDVGVGTGGKHVPTVYFILVYSTQQHIANILFIVMDSQKKNTLTELFLFLYNLLFH